jgi:NADH-quinone oxidoreductase subunit C
MSDVETLQTQINERLAQFVQQSTIDCGELTLVIAVDHLTEACLILRDEPLFDFKLLVDVCGVDYLHYGLSEWETNSATATGFERGRDTSAIRHPHLNGRPRFGVVYHLLSIERNHRVRLKVYLEEHQLKVASVNPIWPAANWFEREAFDLFGIEFVGHPDLRRLLTDYGFIGHPFRKDFPLIGNVEARYDANLRRVVYEPVSIEPRILEPKVIRRDNRYKAGE